MRKTLVLRVLLVKNKSRSSQNIEKFTTKQKYISGPVNIECLSWFLLKQLFWTLLNHCWQKLPISKHLKVNCEAFKTLSVYACTGVLSHKQPYRLLQSLDYYCPVLTVIHWPMSRLSATSGVWLVAVAWPLLTSLNHHLGSWAW